MSTRYIVNNVSGQTIDGNSIDPRYKVYTALLSQNGGDDPQNISADAVQPLTIGVTYQISTNDDAGDFTNIGAPNNNVGTSFVATGTTPNSWGNNPKGGEVSLSYNTGAPVVTVLENTIGNIWFTWDADGQYYINSDDDTFILGKTSTTPIHGDYTAGLSTVISNANQITIFNYNNFPTIGDKVNNIGNTLIEIRVYN